MGLPIIGAIAQVQNMPGFRAAVKEVNSSLQGIGQGMSAMGEEGLEGGEKLSILAGVGLSAVAAAAAAATAAILAVGAGFAAVVAHGITTNATLEKVEIQLEGLTGVGAETLEWAKELSVTRPFTPESVANALQMAYAYGFQGEQAKELVKTTGDVSAAFGDQGERMHRILIALGQMHGAQKINAQDMRQLTEAGIDAWQILADAVGVSVGEVRQQVTDGMVAADFAVQAFTEAMQEKFGGAAERASDSLYGVLGNIRNIMDLASAQISAPIFEGLRDTLAGVRDVLLEPGFQNAVSDFADLMTEMTAGFDPVWIVEGLSDIIEVAIDAIQTIRELQAGIAGLSDVQVMEGAAARMEANTARMEASLDRLANAYADTVSSLNNQIEDASSLAASKMGDIAEKYADRTESINSRLSQSAADYAAKVDDLNRDLTRKLEDQQRSSDEKLLSMAERHAEKRASIEQSIADKIEDYNYRLEDLQIDLGDRIEDVHEKYAERREDLEEQLADATTDVQRAAIQEQLDELDVAEQKEVEKLERKSAREEERLKRDHDRAIEALKRKATAEDEEYAKEVQKEEDRAIQERARTEEEHQYALDQLARRHSQESGQISAQYAKLAEERAKEEEAVQKSYDDQVAALQKRLDDERIAYEQHRTELQNATEEHNRRIEASAEKSAKSVVRYWGAVLGAFMAMQRGDFAGAMGILINSGLAEKLGDAIISTGLIGAGLTNLAPSPSSPVVTEPVVTPDMSQVISPENSQGVTVQGGNTTVDKRINVNANYTKTQSPVTIKQDMQLASMLQRG